MFPVSHSFTHQSIERLQAASSDAEVAKTCIQLLKSNKINNLSCHEWVDWLDKTKKYLETALKIDSNVAALLKVELEFRKKDDHLPVIQAYGKLESGRVLALPQFRLVSINRIEWGLILHKEWEKSVKWNENEEIAAILERKEDQIKREVFTGYTDPCRYAKKYLDAPRPARQITIETAEEAHALVRYLEDLKLIPWRKNLSDCHYLSHAAWEFVDAFAIDPKCFSFVTIGNRCLFRPSDPDSPGPSFNSIKWQYHVALSVQTEKDGLYILDPCVSPEKALKLEEWKKNLNAAHLVPKFESIKELDPTERFIRARTAFAVVTAECFPGLKEKIRLEETPVLKTLVEPFVIKT